MSVPIGVQLSDSVYSPRLSAVWNVRGRFQNPTHQTPVEKAFRKRCFAISCAGFVGYEDRLLTIFEQKNPQTGRGKKHCDFRKCDQSLYF